VERCALVRDQGYAICEDLHTKLVEAAKEDSRSLHAEILVLLREAPEARKAKTVSGSA